MTMSPVSPWRTILAVLWLLCSLGNDGGRIGPTFCTAEHVRELDVDEGVPIGHRIGFIGDFSHGMESGPPYLIVPVTGSVVDTDLMVDHTTGEIRTKTLLDRETRSSYSFVAIPLSGENIRVVIRVLDENDNAPTFPQPVMHIEFPENTPRDVKRTLYPARDLDLGRYNTQRYNIVSGNTNNGFRLSSHRERDGVLYLDLQINGFLDRELTPSYTLVIEALDGGTPPLRGQLTVNITIQDVNDNQPIFNQTRYFASVPENATVGTTVLQVFATDMDAEENGLIEYSINRRQSDKEQIFRIDPMTGVIEVNKPLDFETRELHELVVVARDNGLQPLTTTAFISIRVTDVNDNQPTIQVIFLSDDATPKISESAQPGEFVARISVNDPDSKAEYSNVNVTLTGGDGHFGLTTRDNIIYLVIVSLPLDRESQPMYTLNVIASDTGKPPLHATKTIFLQVTDINDNAPEFEQSVYNANVMEVSEPGTSVIKVVAVDRDEGNNSMIQYFLAETPETHSQWFQIDQTSGLISTRAQIDCETEPVPELTVIARDNGQPALSSSAKVLVTIHDVNDNEPIFDQSFYNATVPENETNGRCILKVSAMDPDCGVNSIINYTIGDQPGKYLPFEIKATTGELCVSRSLDYEQQSSYEFPIIATDRGGLSTTAMVQIRLTDINDNRPVFYPRLYNVSLAEPLPSTSTPIAVIAATDADSGRLGIVSYRIMTGNDAGLFRIDRVTGEIFLTRGNLNSNRAQRCHHLNISASDGGGLRSIQEAEMLVCISDSTERPPVFEKSRYNFYVKEDAKMATSIGSVQAKNNNPGNRGSVKYSIYSGDPAGYFTIDSATGTIKIANPLDHEAHAQVLLNIQAFSSENPASFGHTQVYIEIEDVNDNAPEFQSDIVRLSIPENTVVNQPLYIVNARDKDSGKNGAIVYRLVFANVTRRISPLLFTNMNHISGSYASDMFKIDRDTGALTLSRALDFEVAQSHSFIVMASDQGSPQQSANMTVVVDVQDVNDNPPVFDQSEYAVKISESVTINTQIIQVVAHDKDIGNNARLTYSILEGNGTKNKHCDKKSREQLSKLFGIFPNSGWLFLKGTLDRETCDYYEIHIMAMDNGSPPATATTKLIINVLDYNDNEPKFELSQYEFNVEENLANHSVIGSIKALDKDSGVNAQIRYSLVATKSTFDINPTTGVIRTIIPLDREITPVYDLVAEARDQGSPPRSTRVNIKIVVLDVNDNDPSIMDPQEDVVSVREQQPVGTEVVRVRAIDKDSGKNASITYSIVKSRDSDGFGIFVIDPNSGIIRTKVVLDHGERSIYRITIAASDNGAPPRQTLKLLRVEVLDLDDNRPTFTSSSLQFKVREDAPIGMVIGAIREKSSLDYKNLITGNSFDVIYTLTPVSSDVEEGCFDIDRKTGSLVVSRTLDREKQQDYKLEIRALDTSSSNNPQSSAITIDIEIIDVNDNAPKWDKDPVRISIPEDTPTGSVLYNFTATDKDDGLNSVIQYRIVGQSPNHAGQFEIDSLTGSFRLEGVLDYENTTEYVVIIQAQDQSFNASERLATLLTLFVTIEDVNDNSPEFVVPATDDSVVVPANYRDVGDVIMRVAASDKDQGLNGKVSYRIQSGNDRFKINEETGEVILMKPLMEGTKPTSSNDVDSKQYYDLTIVASDNGKPNKRETKRHIRVEVNAAQGKPPRFKQQEYLVNVSENTSPGTFVVQLGVNSFDGQNGTRLKFVIPERAANDFFSIDASSGSIHTKGRLDRERKSTYRIPVFVFETETIGHRKNEKARDLENSIYRSYDMTTVQVNVLDENDNAPEFAAGACYTLSVPENNELTVIHTVAAFDLDDGHNGEIVYSITGGNIGNKFTIDMHTGELTAKPLDREQNHKYLLQITAQDRGSPLSYSASCNISVRVEDQNDNEPRFELTKYTTKVDEDVPIGFHILQVKAIDPDWGINAKIMYSLANESHWLFTIDNKSGVISTTGYFDREQESVYNFAVIATDGGKYDSRSQQVPVQVFIVDVNDNKPVFERHPFSAKVPTLVQPGQALIQVSANDLDQGINGEIFYSLADGPKAEHFRINPVTGVLSATQSLASDSGKMIYIEVIATDKGNPPLSTSGLIELRVGEISSSYPKLLFKNDTIQLKLKEHMTTGSPILQLQAVRSDGRRNRVSYAIVSGSRDAEAFLIDSNNGEIRVADEEKLDYEIYKDNALRFTVVAKSEDLVLLYGFCSVEITLEDVNDNAPRFTQQQYSTRVWEGNNKGTFVFQVQAFDADSGLNSKVLYHIVDGNHDNAFIIEPAFSGILKTNIVLDREIRDTYRLKIIATDEGVPQLTGTGTIIINIIDINDNQPTFPPKKVITVNEGTEIGSVLTTVTANDVDTSPVLTYSLVDVDPMDAWANKYLAMDQFSGKIILTRRFDYEARKEYQVKIIASDAVVSHTAETILTIRIADDNDNSPQFDRAGYYASLPDSSGNDEHEIMLINSTDLDSGENAAIKYSFVENLPGFRIDSHSGVLFANVSRIDRSRGSNIFLTVVAKDGGVKPRSSEATVLVHLSEKNLHASFNQKQFRVSINEDLPPGSVVVRLAQAPFGPMNALISDNANFKIVSGNQNDSFRITYPNATIVVAKPLDREVVEFYHLQVAIASAGRDENATISVFISIADANDNFPVFPPANYSVEISEATTIKQSIAKVDARDADQENSPNSEIAYDITSGNDLRVFSIDLVTGVIFVNHHLDYETGPSEYHLVIRACDSGVISRCALQPFTVFIQDANDNEPKFPVSEYLEVVAENEQPGLAVFTARATDLDRGKFGQLRYSLERSPNDEDGWKVFAINVDTGIVSGTQSFDYEQKSLYEFRVKAMDAGMKSTTVNVKIMVESRDEFSPQFTERTYRFAWQLGNSDHVPMGAVFGHVSATDKDKGPDGRILYQLTNAHPYFKVNRTTGAVVTKKKLTRSMIATEREISLVVTASSGHQGSLSNMTVAEIVFAGVAGAGFGGAGDQGSAENLSSGLADWALALLILLILVVLSFATVFVFLHMRNRRHKQTSKPNLNTSDMVVGGHNNAYVDDPSNFDTIQIGRGTAPSAGQFGPPKYDEIPPYGRPHHGQPPTSSNSGAPTTSELSGSEQSNSSGRGSAEDGEGVDEDDGDEEIRMINEGNIQVGIGMASDDRLSDASVQNTQEYLARLGIVDTLSTKPSKMGNSGHGTSTSSRHGGNDALMPIEGIYDDDDDDDDQNDADLRNIIYAKLNDVTGGGVPGSGAGSAGPGTVVGGGGSGRMSCVDDAATTNGSGSIVGGDHGFGHDLHPVVGAGHHGMNGSLSSIVHSEEELTGSYNWDYLLDWGPQYQPLAHVFSEIARLKDDTMSVHSGNSGVSNSTKGGSLKHGGVGAKQHLLLPPPLLTNVAPRTVPGMPSKIGGNHHTIPTHNQYLLPRSPISHDASNGFVTTSAISPSFSPNLSPLARSPSVSPPHHLRPHPPSAPGQQTVKRKNY